MRNKTKQIVDHANTVLQMMGKPMHATEIFTLLVDAELYDGTRQSMYNMLYNQIRDADTEEEILFHFLGRGVFATRSIPLSAEFKIVTPKPRPPHGINYNRKGDLPGDKERRIKYIQTAEENKTCGNCRFIQYKGVQADIKQVGGCAKYSISKRGSVVNSTPACVLWQIASLNKARKNKRKVTL